MFQIYQRKPVSVRFVDDVMTLYELLILVAYLAFWVILEIVLLFVCAILFFFLEHWTVKVINKGKIPDFNLLGIIGAGIITFCIILGTVFVCVHIFEFFGFIVGPQIASSNGFMW